MMPRIIRLIVLVSMIACSNHSSHQNLVVKSTPAPIAPSTKYNAIQFLVGDPSFTSFVAAIKSAKLIGYLSGKGPFTVFAIPNEAFAKLPEPILKDLFGNEEGKSANALVSYHIVDGLWTTSEMVTGLQMQTKQGKYLFCDMSNGPAVNGVALIQINTAVSNGVIHVVDKVLLPVK